MRSQEILKSEDGVEWKATDSNCPLCNSNEVRFIGIRGGEFHRDHKGVETKIVQCRNCSLFYTKPTMLPLTNPYQVAGGNYFVGTAHNRDRKYRLGEEWIKQIEELINGKKGVVIEAACGKGEFLLAAKDRGWDVRGVEMTDYFVDEAGKNGIDVEAASVENSLYLENENSCDAIFMLAMLEHLYDPVSMMRKAHRVLKPGGIALINVPNEVTSLVNKLGNLYVKVAYGRSWTMSLSPTFSPFHVVGFSPNSLRTALESVGFEIIALETASGTNELPPAKNIKQRIERISMTMALMLGKIADKFNKGNEIMCWARKKKL